MDLLVFKLIVTPLLLLAASMAVRRWGEAIGGFLVGLPLTSGPISVFLALEHGPVFATQATSGSLTATVAQTGFCLAYCRLAHLGWPTALGGACAAFALVASTLQSSGIAQTGLFVAALLAMSLVLHLTPREAVVGSKLASPWWDLPARMVLITALVVGVTLIAPHIGPGVSGVLASFPFIATILAVFAHRMIGGIAAKQVLRGMVSGLLGFAVFFYVLSLTLTRTTLLLAYGTAVACALTIQACAFYRMRRLHIQRAK
ncbi:hypothetical protein [Noviherbaspirillum galbum]|uniref:Uncharacterized protein n=1 Tax=Noviherbaspirillum galbum TaxID=2709383 RepID=A0A6B3SYU6_9BURK|nr:hypothetical protein [Noviherbaspirillum galbum]NEX64816.1 hypothetical protein [Noviherbaspirillum galbum]